MTPSPLSPGQTLGSSARVVRDLDERTWSAFVDEHPDASVFHTPEMARVFAATRHHRPECWAAVGTDGAPRALFTPVAIATFAGPLRSLATRTVSFAGPLRTEADGAALGALLDAYRDAGARGSLFTEVRHHVTDPAVSAALGERGFEPEPHLNFMVDLSVGEEALWKRVAPAARRNVQKARRSGVQVVEASGAEDIAQGYAVLRDVYRRIQVPIPDRSLFDAAHEMLSPLGWFSMLLARSEGRTIGVLSLLRFRGVITYWYTGTLREHAGLRAGDLLTWHAISTEAASGGRVLDFGGAGRPDQPYGVRAFKAKYGGELVEPGRSVWVAAPRRLRAATKGYAALRRFL